MSRNRVQNDSVLNMLKAYSTLVWATIASTPFPSRQPLEAQLPGGSCLPLSRARRSAGETLGLRAPAELAGRAGPSVGKLPPPSSGGAGLGAALPGAALASLPGREDAPPPTPSAPAEYCTLLHIPRSGVPRLFCSVLSSGGAVSGKRGWLLLIPSPRVEA